MDGKTIAAAALVGLAAYAGSSAVEGSEWYKERMSKALVEARAAEKDPAKLALITTATDYTATAASAGLAVAIVVIGVVLIVEML